MGLGKKKVTTITFDCKPWQAPRGGANCDSCGDDGLPCNEYKCKSLGQTCEFLNKGTSEEACVDISPNDASAPIISPDRDNLLEGYDYVEESRLGFNVVGPTSDGCLPVYTPVNFGVELDEPGQCKFDVLAGTDFENMETFFGNSNLYRFSHLMTVNMPNLAALQGEEISSDARADFNLFVRCSDRSGNENVADYAISFCVSPEPDTTAPIISRFSPASEGYVAFDDTERKVNFYVNEPADCKWDVQDVDYDVMINDVACVQDVESITPFGFACEVNLPVGEDENNFYFRCLDQPWLENDNPDGLIRNKNSESVEYVLRKSLNQLEIVSITPKDETIIGGNVEFVDVDLIVQTTGGADGTRRTCEFDFGNNGRYVDFFETGGDTHKQPLSLYFDSYEIGIRCEDEAGNTASGSTQFDVELDSVGPIITRFYNLNGVLNVITNEPSECSYSFDGCGFSFENGTQMAGFGTKHTSSFDTSLTYYVKCQDEYENAGSCIAISGGLF